MIEADKKSTAAGMAEVSPGLWLDSRLALVNPSAGWLAVADVHYGYELARRAGGGLFPFWGMGSIEERFAALLDDHAPETVVFAGDIIDAGVASREAMAWLESVRERCARMVLVAGNHDSGPIRRALDFRESFQTEDGVFFHHGHLSPPVSADARMEVTGHWHPSVLISDGAGLRLRLPSLVRERLPGVSRERWVLPAFSPWAGGVKWRPRHPEAEWRQWVCGEGRVLPWEVAD